ncbi:4-hydroxythreonine-4-phosphate dehydrogenase PdxA, partial [bacterium]|nr:4-hydroxythreonine-4-phosphate dehydrogenase PdxA [bacterium]
MKSSNKPIIGITLGDPLGVGPQIVAQLLNSSEIYNHCIPKIIGNVDILEKAQKFIIDKKLSPLPSQEDAARMAIDAIDEAITLAHSKEIDALITMPVNKKRLQIIDKNFDGHTDYLAIKSGLKKDDVYMAFSTNANNKNIFLTLTTRHIPTVDAIKSLTKEKIFKTISAAHNFLKNTIKINTPKIAVLGINPHAGENGALGAEENDICRPAIEMARNNGLDIYGPIPADTAFTPNALNSYNAWIAHYHDQGLIPIKTLNFSETVNITMGLPFIRTSVAHGTAEDIAWKGVADTRNLLATV